MLSTSGARASKSCNGLISGWLNNDPRRILFILRTYSSPNKSDSKLKTKSTLNIKKKGGKDEDAKGGDHRPGVTAMAPELPKSKAKLPKRSPEQLKLDMERAKEYSRRCMHEHRQQAAAESTRLKLKKAAIAALPENLRLAAMEYDYTPFPPDRIPASLTPPISGYVDEAARAAQRSAAMQKSR